ncbi:hypothetical protein CAAN1_24S01376 [[Candida] anglica]|uniref:Uncharacterized protein n=1 Tax=[Candida] anglica TaxID=148631 RepID=A0ABP0EEW9_9ASCO
MFNPLLRQSVRSKISTGLGLRGVFQNSFSHQPVGAVARTLSRPSTISRTNNGGLKLLFGATISFVAVNASGSRILNDAAYSAGRLESKIASSIDEVATKANQTATGSRFGGQLNYNELTIGSLTGLFLGIIAGKLSSMIVFLTLSGYFLTQFLESRGIISIPWGQMVQIGSERIDLKRLVLEKPSFKIPFVLTFLIAAYNI